MVSKTSRPIPSSKRKNYLQACSERENPVFQGCRYMEILEEKNCSVEPINTLNKECKEMISMANNLNTTKEQERAELHRAIWQIANDLRGSVDGWDFKQYVLGMLFLSIH